ncbi:MAG: tRNA dihydrouridine synthase DusB [Oscillospiraceae bacterium]
MFKIKDILIGEGASLAPMAGVTDKAFRDLCQSFNCSFSISEMVSAKALVMGDKKTPFLMENSEGTRPFGIQVFGHEPITLGLSCQIIERYNPDFININAGCPAPKITNNKGGSSLLKTPDLIYDIIKEMRNYTDKPITLKIRKGFDDYNVNAVEVAQIAEKAGAEMIIVHGRTRDQMYKPPVDIKIIEEVKNAVNIPVIANGDVENINDYIDMKNLTNADGIMIGRGALGSPWIFNQIYHYLKTGETLDEPTLDKKMDIMKTHINILCQNKGEYIGMREARKHCGWYMKGLKDANNLRRICGQLSTLNDLDLLIKNIKIINIDTI